MAQETGQKSKRDTMLERLQGRYPDREFADDEAMYDQINTDYDDYDNQLNGYKENEQAFANLFTSDPRSAHFLMTWKNGADPLIALIEEYGDEFQEALQDPEKRKQLAEAQKAYVAKVAKEKEYEEEYQKNIQESIDTKERLMAEKGISNENMSKALEILEQIVADGIMGKFTPQSIGMAMKAIEFEDAVETAAQEGLVRGKNERIEERLRNGQRGDGMANLDSRNAGSGVKAPTPDLGALGNYGDNSRNIWERGGERRIHNDRG